jgi:Uma2 family endonuclease
MVNQYLEEVTEPGLHMWTVDDYHRMIASEILTTETRVELIEGQIIEMSPQQPPHAATTQRTWKYLNRMLAGKADIRIQLPITLPPNSEPEPDIAVVRINPREYISGHPTPDDIFLLIEVADSTFTTDRNKKSRIYAKAKIPEYWVLNVNSQQIYIFREPGENGYTQEIILDINAKISLITFPEIEIEIKQLFP